MSGQLAGKVALVTGASRGIGRAIATKLASDGADVVVAARTLAPTGGSLGSLEETADAIREHGRRLLTLQADLLDPRDVATLISRAEEGLGPVDILVNNAAYMGEDMYDPFLDMSVDSWRQQVELNLNVPYALMKAVIPGMISRGGGRIINITTLEHGQDLLEVPDDSLLPGKGGVGAAYAASKAALNSMTNTVAYEMRGKGILITAVHPGFTATENAKVISAKFNFPIQYAHSMDVPAQVVGYLAACPEPMQYTGKYLFAADLYESLGLAADA
jgi:NAD(P)-dependent dehydrogenase (short-subunit alcohol dehydrogenase family)